MTGFGLTIRTADETRHLFADAHPLTSLDQLLREAGVPLPAVINGRDVPADTRVGNAGLRDGAVIEAAGSRTAGFDAAITVAAPGTPALLVASGPGAGASITVPPAGCTVGRHTPIPLHDNEVSTSHLLLRSTGGTFTVADSGSTNGTVIAGEPVSADRPVTPGELIWVGRSALTVGVAPAADAALSSDDQGMLRYSRSPRLVEQPRTRPPAVPSPPPAPERLRFPVLAIAAPVLVGVLMAVLMKHPEYLAFTALSPIMVLGNLLSDRRRGKGGYRQQMAEYEQRRDQALAADAAARRAELAYRRHVHPDPATLLLIAKAPSHRLWERRPADKDFLALRVGTGKVRWSLADQTRLAGSDDTTSVDLLDAPAVLPVIHCGAIGVTGPTHLTRALARSMLLSLTVLHSPAEVSVTVLTSPDAEADWAWLRWLPHSRQPESNDGVVRIGNDPESIRLRLIELRAILDAQQVEAGAGQARSRPARAEIVVLDGSYDLRLRSDLDSLLRDGPSAGIYTICLDDTPTRLPQECGRAIVQLTDDHGGAAARIIGPELEVAGTVADVVTAGMCEVVARAMAPIREAGMSTVRGRQPESLRFLHAAGLEPLRPEEFRSIWAAGGRTTEALLGATADGPFTLDLAHGPHLLVAGTTGSGKSELLQTLVASLSVGNRPDALNFVLIDYKGGATFRGCEPLPHTVGVLTDLDEFLVERALTSLRAELQRRKAVLEQADKTSIELYWDALATAPAADPLPRLVIMVDEFAGMAEKLPEQLRSLIQIGQQGRSLGVHLVLATQRPAGVVTAEMRANINLRIALRVASSEDSRDVIETVDAARIPAVGSAGRAFAWLAGGGRPVAFQTARVGGSPPGARPDRPQVHVVSLEWNAMGLPADPADQPQVDSGDPTDLSNLVDAIRLAASQADCDEQRSPWRPPLPDLITLAELPRPPDALQVVYGLTDRPRAQEQTPAVFDLARGGHLLVAGAPQSGRTTLLRTLAGGLATHVSPTDVHLYVVDCGGGLAALSTLPHCGAVVTQAEPDRIDRLLGRLTAELERRTRFLSAHGHSDLTEYREGQPPGDRPPFLAVFVDRYDAFVTALEHVDNGRLVGQFQRLVRDGLAAGIRAVVTGDRSLVTGRLGSWAEDKIVLRLADRNDYPLVGLHGRSVPSVMPSGRGLHVPGGDLLHAAVLAADPQGAVQNRTLREWAQECRQPDVRPFRVDPLPTSISFEQARELPQSGSGILVGVGGDDLSQVRVDAPGLLVIGQPGSGRSTALAVQALSLADEGAPVVLVTPRRSVLTSTPAHAVRLHLTTTDADAATKFREALASPGPLTVIVDDAELLGDTALGDELTTLYRGIRDTGHRVVAATNMDATGGFRPWFLQDLAKARCGLVLGPNGPGDGGPVGARLPLSVLAGGIQLRAVLVHNAAVLPVQVPTVSDFPASAARSGVSGLVMGVDGGSAAR